MKKYIIILIASLMAARPLVAFTLERTPSMAQVEEESLNTMTPQEERLLHQKAFELIRIYSQTSLLFDEEDEDKFIGIFESPETQIYNDLLSLSYEKTLSAFEYVATLKRASDINVSVKNIRKTNIINDGEKWNIQILMDKSISFLNFTGTYIESNVFYNGDYTLAAMITYEKESGKCYISSIMPEKELEEFPKNYSVLQRKHQNPDKRDFSLTINGNINTPFNRYDQIVLRPNYSIKYLGTEVGQTDVEGSEDHKFNVNYFDKSLRIKLNAGFSIANFIPIQTADDLSPQEASMNKLCFGVDFGYVLKPNGRLLTGVFAGIGLSWYKNDLHYANQDLSHFYDSGSNADEDDNRYTRHYSLHGLHQEIDATYFNIPVYADLEYRVTSMFSIYGDFGLKFQLRGGSASTNIGEYETWGVYPDYGNLEIRNTNESPIILNDFGMHEASQADYSLKNKLGIYGLLGLGLRFNIGQSFAVDAGLQCQVGTDSWNSDGNSSNEVVNYNLKEGDRFYLAHKINHSALKVGLGLIYKF